MIKAKNLYENIWDFVQKKALTKGHRRKMKTNSPKNILSRDNKKQARAFYKKYSKISTVFHNFYTDKTGVFNEKYMPDDFFYNEIDRYFNDLRGSKTIDNKCYYHSLFFGIDQPKNILMRINGFWFNENHEMISKDDLENYVEGNGELFLKQAVGSYGGHGVFCIDNSNEGIYANFNRALGKISRDVVVQQPIKQSELLGKINPTSVNTIRMLSLLSEDGVKIYSSVLRMGISGARVDNASSGGITCGIKSDGTLRKYAYTKTGDRFENHPTSGVVFEGYVIPSYDNAIKLVEKAHKKIPHFRMVSWDIAIGFDGKPILIEANLTRGELDFHQLNNGPIFGDDTERILEEVFKNRR